MVAAVALLGGVVQHSRRSEALLEYVFSFLFCSPAACLSCACCPFPSTLGIVVRRNGRAPPLHRHHPHRHPSLVRRRDAHGTRTKPRHHGRALRSACLVRHAKRESSPPSMFSHLFVISCRRAYFFMVFRIGRSCQPVRSCRLCTGCTGKMLVECRMRQNS